MASWPVSMRRSRAGCSSAPWVPGTQCTGHIDGSPGPRQVAGSTSTPANEPWSRGCQSRVATTSSKRSSSGSTASTMRSPSSTASAPPGQKSFWKSMMSRASTPARLPPTRTPRKGAAMPYELPPLPYAYDALEPHIDEETMRLHHDKHHATYVDRVNTALEGTEWDGRPIEQVLANLDLIPEEKR